jgi:endonuclease/exonuclease/phosphatase family metal-dependent hydrolase
VLRVLTFNLGLPALPPAGRIALTQALHARLAAAPQLLRGTGADVIALQEVFAHRHAEFLRCALRDIYPHAVMPQRRRSLLGSGLMFLSRLPIAADGFAPQSARPRLGGALSEPGCLWITVHVPGIGAVPFVTAHVTAAGAWPGRPDAGRQRRQGEIAHVLATAQRHGPALLAGDFNCSPTVNPGDYRDILSAGYLDAHIVAGGLGRESDAATWDSANPLNKTGRYRNAPSQRIDHVFIPRALASRLTPSVSQIVMQERIIRTGSGMIPLSDHYGLLVGIDAAPVVAAPAMRRGLTLQVVT